MKQKKPKVMFIIDFVYGITGGTEKQLVNLINNLDKDKYELYLISLRSTRWLQDNSNRLKCDLKTFDIIKLKNPTNAFLFFLIVKTIRNIRPDIVMTLFPLSNILGVLASRIANVKMIVSTRRDYGLWLDNSSIYALRFANRFVRGIITNSHRVKDLTCSKERFDHLKIHVIYNGLKLKKLSQSAYEKESLRKVLGIPTHSKIIGIVAGLRPMKRHKTFLKGAKRILDLRKDVDFLLVGDGPLRAQLEYFANKLGIRENVHFVGWQADVLPYLGTMNLGVNSSANEGMSNAIMEFMAYGVPCIVARAGGNEELIEHGINGFTFELDNDEDLAERILDLLDNKRKQEEFIAESKEKVLSEFTLERMVAAYDRYFTRMLMDRNREENL